MKVAAVIVGLLFAGLIWGFLRIRGRMRDAETLALGVREEDLADLVAEARRVIIEKLERDVDFGNPMAVSRVLDDLLRSNRLVTTQVAFERPEHPGWYVLPLGALLGECLRVDPRATWLPLDGGGLQLSFPHEEGEVLTYPFHKILKQASAGSPGDLVAYVSFAVGDRDVSECLSVD